MGKRTATDDHRARGGRGLEPLESRVLLTAAPTLLQSDVDQILAHAASQALPTQIITVVDRNGDILGMYAGSKANLSFPLDNKHKRQALLSTPVESVARARTAAFFESNDDAFTTRTARFIIQDHFPFPVDNTPDGPLYGVQFSSLPGSDVYSGPAISGDPGGVPLFKDGVAVGGVGVAGDGSDVIARNDLPYNPLAGKTVFNGSEEPDFDEAVALAGAKSFMASPTIQATSTFIDGLRLPYTAEKAARGKASKSLSTLIHGGSGSLVLADVATIGINLEGNVTAKYAGRTSAAVIDTPPIPYPAVSFGGIGGFAKNTNSSATNFGLVSGVARKGQHLTIKDINKIITNAASQALLTRAGIRQPLGLPAKVHIAVTDTAGNILGVFDMNDGTNFSYDVAVQKARTAAYFSDDTHALSARAIGFLSQRYYPIGISGARTGPLYHLQNVLSLGAPLVAPLENGITIFPGGEPLYKNGVLVGAIGVSGDGVDQDDFISYAGTAGFQPPAGTRSDEFVGGTDLASFLEGKLDNLAKINPALQEIVDQCVKKLQAGLDGIRLPYVKFPRNPYR